MQHLTNTFLLHGFETLELLSTLEEEDLDELAITNAEDRAKLLTAAQMLLDYEGMPFMTCESIFSKTGSSTKAVFLNNKELF